MGRFVSTSAEQLSSVVSQLGVIAANAAIPIAIGDLVSMGESGLLYPVSQAVGVANENNTTAGPSALVAAASSEGTGYTSVASRVRTAAELGNGNIAYAYTGDGTTNTTGLRLRIRNLMGIDLVNRIDVSAAASIGSFRVLKVNDTSFAVAWAEGTALKFAIYSNAGAVIAAAAAVATLRAASERNWSAGQLANGDIVFAYDVTGTLDCRFKRYNSAGILQGAETVVEAASDPQYINVMPLAAGGFVIYYYRNAAVGAMKFGRYSAQGVLQGALTTTGAYYLGYTASGGGASGNLDGFCYELSNGNLLFLSGGADGFPDICLYDASGGALTTIDLGVAASLLQYEAPGVCVREGSFVIAYRRGSGGTFMRIFDNAGATLQGVVQVDSSTNNNTNAGSGVFIESLGAAGFIVMTHAYDHTGGTRTLKLVCCTANGTLIGSAIQISASTTNPIAGLWPILHSSGNLVIALSGGASTLYGGFGTYRVQRKSVLGVAVQGAAKNSRCKVATVGTFDLTTNYVSGGSFDQRTAAIPGPRGSIVGNTAILFGLQ